MKVNPSAVAAVIGGVVAVVIIRYLETHEPNWAFKKPPFWLRFVPARARTNYLTHRAAQRITR